MIPLIVAALIIPLLTAAFILFARARIVIKRIHMAGSIITSTVLLTLTYGIYLSGPVGQGLLYMDHLSAVLVTLIAILTFTAALFSLSYMDKEVAHEPSPGKAVKRYYILFQIFTFTMISVLVVENLGLMWVAVEATTLASALLVAFSFSRAAIEAAWKYVMVCTVGICLALLGTILLYFAQLSTGLEGEALSWLALKAIGGKLDPSMVKIAFIFIIIGYGTKVGLAPMHTWLPDAHSQAPSPVSGLLSGALLSCALYVMMRNIAIVRDSLAFDFIQQLLVGLGLFSVMLVVPFLLVQHDVKRLLAYSSVEHMGIITLALGIGTPLAVYGALLHIFNHAIAKSGLFYLAGIITQEYRTKQIMRIRGILAQMPRLGSLFLVFVLIITGAPPFGIFFSKFIITWAAFAGGFTLVGTALLVLLGAVFAGMMHYSFQMVFSSQTGTEHTTPMGAGAATAVIVSLLLITISGFYLPDALETVLHQAATIVTGG
jgi:hydrogenase-4 component F